MPARNPDLHGNVPDNSSVALIIIDMINDLEFEGGELLGKYALPAAQKIAELKRRAKAAKVPVIYVNDNFGRWNSDLPRLVNHCLTEPVRGKPIVELLVPDEDDYFVLKPKHSMFFATVLDVLLAYLKVKTLVITGVAGNICVLFSANEAYMRDFLLWIPGDCSASNHPNDNEYALKQMESILKADIRPSTELDWEELKRWGEQSEADSQQQNKVSGNSSSNGPKPEIVPQPEQLSTWKAG